MGTSQKRMGFTCTSQALLEGFRQPGRGRGECRAHGGAICSPDSALMSHSVKCQLLMDGLLRARLVGPDELCPQVERCLTGSCSVIFNKRLVFQAP